MNKRNALLALCLAGGSLATGVATPASADVYVRIAPPAPRLRGGSTRSAGVGVGAGILELER